MSYIEANIERKINAMTRKRYTSRRITTTQVIKNATDIYPSFTECQFLVEMQNAETTNVLAHFTYIVSHASAMESIVNTKQILSALTANPTTPRFYNCDGILCDSKRLDPILL